MKESVVLKYRIGKFLKIFSILLLFLLLGLIIWEFVRIAPKDIKFSNVTSSSFTVSWNTKFPTKGTAVLIEGNNKFPISLSIFDDNNWYDSRDVKKAELESTSKTANNVSENNSFGVTIENFVTERIVSEKGSYYTHHIEVTGLDSQKQYSVMIGDSLISLNVGLFSDNPIISTSSVPEKIETPHPAYGLIKDSKGEDLPIDKLSAFNDGIVYFNLLDEESQERSNVFSSPLSESGAWYLDLSSAVDSKGSRFLDRLNSGITNIYGEIVLDAGNLGTWKKTVSINDLSPAEAIVLNAKNILQDASNPTSLIRIDSTNILPEGTVQKASAGSCQWIGYCSCGERVDNKWKDCACDPQSTYEARGCNKQSNPSAENVAQGLGCKENCGCSNGAKGDRVFYNGQCKQCGISKEGYWGNVDNTLCTDTSGKVFKPQQGDGGGGNGGADGIRTEISLGAPCSDEDGCTCKTGDDNGTYIPGSGTPLGIKYIANGGKCDANACSNCDGVRTEISEGTKCSDGDGCICRLTTYGTSMVPIVKEININIDIICDDSLGSSNQGPSGGADSQNVETTECWENIALGTLFRGEGENRQKCSNGQWTNLSVFEKSIYTGCSPDRRCALFNRCVTNNTVYSCQGGLVKPVTEEGAENMRSAIQIKTIAAGTKCTNGPCLCSSGPLKNELVENNQFCLEVVACSVNDAGSICNLDGKKCSDQEDAALGGYPCNALLPTKSVSKVFASETVKGSKKYIIDSQTGFISGIQEGIYLFENEGKTYMFDVESKDLEANAGKILVYIDKNNDGVYNEGTDVKISELASEISISAVKEKYSYTLKEGFNFVNFPFLIDNSESRTAAGLLKTLNDTYGDHFYSISKYDGKWKIVGQNVDLYDTNDFQLVPGQGYIIKSKKNIDISIVGQPVLFENENDKAPITLYQGWNLIGTYGSNVKQYTAKTLIEGISNYKPIDFTADNVSRWESDVQRYDGLQITNQNGIDITYGFDFPINSQQAYFVRILKGQGNWQQDIHK